MSTISTVSRYRCDQHVGCNEIGTVCSIHPIYGGDAIIGAYHATGGVEDGRIMFESDDHSLRMVQVSLLAERIHEGNV